MREKSIEDRFKKLSPKEHILKRPNMYIGNISNVSTNLFVLEDINKIDESKFVNKNILYNAGFLKLYDEILVNASDHYIRTGLVKYIKINVDKDHVTIENDGPGIPIEIHKKHKIYIPEMVFDLHAGENFDDSENRIIGGLNGLGASLTNIFSNKFIIETSDGKNKYLQTFSDNMNKKTKPLITKSNKNYTKITYYPDFKRFEITEIDEEMQSIFLKRAIDIAAYNTGVKVYYNNILIPIKSFKDYIKMFTQEQEFFYEKLNDSWEIGICKSLDNSFNQISMVNGISTYNGGTHVNAITNQITKKLSESIIKKNKKINIKQNDIKNRLFVFVNAKIVNPVFDTQSKENLTSKIILSPEISDNLIKKLLSSEITEELLKFLDMKEQYDTKKEIVKHKIKISKLDDAKKAGTSESEKCIMFFSEGDSAAASVIAGISSVPNPDYFGVFPLKGKPLNVRGMELSKIRDNDEIKNIISILGLEFGKKYTDTKKLRYGKVVLMADADCIDENILILTKRGYIAIKDVTYEDEVLTHTNEWKKIINIIQTEKNNIISLKVNGEIYSFSENHEIPVLRNNKIELIKAKDIINSDQILKKKN